jgi:cytochrome P450
MTNIVREQLMTNLEQIVRTHTVAEVEEALQTKLSVELLRKLGQKYGVAGRSSWNKNNKDIAARAILVTVMHKPANQDEAKQAEKKVEEKEKQEFKNTEEKAGLETINGFMKDLNITKLRLIGKKMGVTGHTTWETREIAIKHILEFQQTLPPKEQRANVRLIARERETSTARYTYAILNSSSNKFIYEVACQYDIPKRSTWKSKLSNQAIKDEAIKLILQYQENEIAKQNKDKTTQNTAKELQNMTLKDLKKTAKSAEVKEHAQINTENRDQVIPVIMQKQAENVAASITITFTLEDLKTMPEEVYRYLVEIKGIAPIARGEKSPAGVPPPPPPPPIIHTTPPARPATPPPPPVVPQFQFAPPPPAPLKTRSRSPQKTAFEAEEFEQNVFRSPEEKEEEEKEGIVEAENILKEIEIQLNNIISSVADLDTISATELRDQLVKHFGNDIVNQFKLQINDLYKKLVDEEVERRKEIGNKTPSDFLNQLKEQVSNIIKNDPDPTKLSLNQINQKLAAKFGKDKVKKYKRKIADFANESYARFEERIEKSIEKKEKDQDEKLMIEVDNWIDTYVKENYPIEADNVYRELKRKFGPKMREINFDWGEYKADIVDGINRAILENEPEDLGDIEEAQVEVVYEEEEAAPIPFPERWAQKPVPTATGRKTQVLQSQDLAQVLDTITQKRRAEPPEDLLTIVPRIQNDIQKCLGLF